MCVSYAQILHNSMQAIGASVNCSGFKKDILELVLHGSMCSLFPSLSMSLGFHPQYCPCVVTNDLHLTLVLCLGTLTMVHILLRSSLWSLESPAEMNLLVLKTMQSSFSRSAFSRKHSHTSERHRAYQGSNEITHMKNKIDWENTAW